MDIVGYRRTSTDDQRLGIDAQDAILARIASERGSRVVRAYTEHESGGNNERPEIDKALKHARRIGAAVCVAKLDRLARDSGFLMKLYDGDVPIIFGDMPEIDGSAASRFMVQTMANVAEFYRRRISENTKEALGALKAKGVKLGTPENLNQAGRVKGSRKAAKRRVAKAVDDMSDVAEIAGPMRSKGLTLQAIADHLNVEGYVTRKGSSWNPIQVKRVLDRSVSP